MQRVGVAGSTLDLGVRQNCLNKEYLELRQDGEEKPPSATEPTASAKGWVKKELGSVKAPKGGQCGEPRALSNVNPPRDYTRTPPYHFKYHYFVFVHNRDTRMRVGYPTRVPWGHSRWHFFAMMPTLFPLSYPLTQPQSVSSTFSSLFFSWCLNSDGYIEVAQEIPVEWMDWLKYHVSPFPQSVPKWEDGFGKKEGRSKNELDRLPGVLVLNSYTSDSVLIFPRSGQPLSLAYSFQELYLMWAVKLTVESSISLRISLLSIPLLEMSGSNFVLQLYLLSLC